MMKATSAVSVILLLTSVSSAQVFVEGPLYPHTAPTPPVQVGGSLAADDGLALVSGLEPEAAGYRGVVYCYERTSDGWSLYQRIPSPGIGDWFGGGVEVKFGIGTLLHLCTVSFRHKSYYELSIIR